MEKKRKSPSQTRSQVLFDSVIESAARILPAFGYARTTTNKIAHRAGISIGSLYQYFPHKDAIFANLLQRELNKHFDEVAAIVEKEKDKPFDEIIDCLVERFYTLYMQGPIELSRELFKSAAKLEQITYILYVRNRVVDVLSDLLVQKKMMDLETARKKVFIALNAFMGIIQTLTLMDGKPMPDAELKHEISLLLKSYFPLRQTH